MAWGLHSGIAAMLLAGVTAPALAISFPEPAPRAHWECVPFARAISGVGIYGDAWTWWDQAEGRYKRGSKPRVGAVLAFIPHNGMQLGHVAVVSEIIDDRTIAVTHANWSPINGARGQIERDVEVRDVSEAGDWSAVRVWFAPLGDLGTTTWPVHGFIYPDAAPQPGAQPRLDYAALSLLDGPRRPAEQAGIRIAYLKAMLPRLAKGQN
jgi:surface antigen